MARKAALDVARAFTWIVINIGVETAEAWRDGLDDAIQTLGDNAQSCPEAPEAEMLGIDLRQLVYGRRKHAYRILFVIGETNVEVLRVRHSRQDLVGADDL
jgi:plasmid stabilization system protein ParE